MSRGAAGCAHEPEGFSAPTVALVAPYVRTVKTSSGATAVQIVHSSRRGSRDIEHIGSAHDAVELATLKAVAQQHLVAGQGELELGLDPAGAVRRSGPLPITSSRM